MASMIKRLAVMLRTLMVAGLLLVAPGRLAWGKAPEVNSLFPAGGRLGQVVEVTAGGSFDRWPVRVWTDAEGLAIEPLEEKGKLRVSVCDDAMPGLAWVRLYDEDGASALRPFLIGTLPEVVEAEPNDGLRKPHALTDSTVMVNGRLEKRGDVDGFSVPLHKGQTLVASVEANRSLGSPMDGILQIASADGFVVAQNDDDQGSDPRLVFEVPSDGTYIVRLFALPEQPDSRIGFSGGASFIYRLTLTTGPFLDHTRPMEVSSSGTTRVERVGWNLPDGLRFQEVTPEAGRDRVRIFDGGLANEIELNVVDHPTLVESPQSQPQRLPVPSSITGQIDPPGDVDVYEVALRKGQAIGCQVVSRAFGQPLDPVVRVLDEAGKVVAEADDNRRERDVTLSATAPADGIYRVEVRDLYGHGGMRFAYCLTVAEPRPSFRLTLAADQFTIEPGKPLTIPVTVDRRNGHAEPIEVRAEGLPEGVSAEVVTSEPKGDTAKSVKLTVKTDAGPISGAFRIVGRSREAGATGLDALASLDKRGHATRWPWLTVKGKAASKESNAKEPAK